MTYHSQAQQDSFLNEHFFKNKKNGVFLDIGANDGVKISNSLFFEKELDWTGICVEPIPELYQKLVNSRDCICLNLAVGLKEGTRKFLRCTGPTEPLSGFVDTYDPRHIERIEREIRQSGGSKTIIDIESRTLASILNEYDITHVDYCSIDTEGSELEILKSIDFNKVTIDFFSIENNYKDPEIDSFLTQNGFALIKYQLGHLDDIYGRIGYFSKN